MDPPGYLPRSASSAAVPDVTQHWLAPDGTLAARPLVGATGAGAHEAAAMRLAWSQGQSLFQMGFLMWMIGSQLSLWTIFFIATMGLAPVRALLGLQQGARAPLPCSLRRATMATAPLLPYWACPRCQRCRWQWRMPVPRPWMWA